jgi:hypothetical protein
MSESWQLVKQLAAVLRAWLVTDANGHNFISDLFATSVSPRFFPLWHAICYRMIAGAD